MKRKGQALVLLYSYIKTGEVKLMLKQAWHGYLASLHPRYLRKAYDDGKLFWIFYGIVIYPVMMQVITGQEEYYDISFLVMTRLFPFMFMMWSDIGSKYLMPKAMFLSPMKEEERKEYINHVIFIKVGMTVIYSICVELFLGLFYSFYIWRFVIITFMNFSLALSSYIFIDSMGKIDEKTYSIVKEKAGNKNLHWLNKIVEICSSATIIMIALLSMEISEGVIFFFEILIPIITIVVMILDIIIVLSEYKATLALASNYELANKLIVKEEKAVKFDLFANKGV